MTNAASCPPKCNSDSHLRVTSSCLMDLRPPRYGGIHVWFYKPSQQPMTGWDHGAQFSRGEPTTTTFPNLPVSYSTLHSTYAPWNQKTSIALSPHQKYFLLLYMETILESSNRSKCSEHLVMVHPTQTDISIMQFLHLRLREYHRGEDRKVFKR